VSGVCGALPATSLCFHRLALTELRLGLAQALVDKGIQSDPFEEYIKMTKTSTSKSQVGIDFTNLFGCEKF
jgi:hypothetical protein